MTAETHVADAASEASPAPATETDEPLIRCSGLHKWYGGVHALKNVDLDFGYNEVLGLVGDNGAGKSTLIKILSGAHRQDSGDIFFQGKRVTFSSPREAMDLGIETIYQYNALAPTLSIERNIFIGREPITARIGRIGNMDFRKMGREAMDALRDVGLHLRSPSTPVEELSGGERQGVTIARAMYFKTKVLILDEPTNHLSIKETNKVLGWVEGLKAQGITSVFITHNLHHVYPIADRLCVLSRGEKAAEMPKSETSIEELTDLIV